MAFRISRVVCILGRPVALGVGRWGSRQLHSASERSVWYAGRMLGILPSECLRPPFQTVSRRSSQSGDSPKVAKDSSAIHRLLLAWWRCTTLGGADQPVI